MIHFSYSTSSFTDRNGKQLHFAIRDGTDETVLWKASVRIQCKKVVLSIYLSIFQLMSNPCWGPRHMLDFVVYSGI